MQRGLPQSGAGPPSQRGYTAAAQAEKGRNVRRARLLDLGVPQNGDPAVRQGQECAGDRRVLRAGHLWIDEQLTGVTVQELPVAAACLPVPQDSSHRGQEVRPECVSRTAAPLGGSEYPRERFGDYLVGLRRRGSEFTRKPPRCFLMSLPDGAECGDVAKAHAAEQPCVVRVVRAACFLRH